MNKRERGLLNRRARPVRILLATCMVFAVAGLPVRSQAQQPEPPTTVDSLAALFEAVRSITGPLGPSLDPLAVALRDLNDAFEAQSTTLGDAAATASGALAEQLIAAVDALNEALNSSSATIGESLAALPELAETVAAAIQGGADQIDGAIRGNEAQLQELGVQLAPVLSRACPVKGPATLVTGLVAFGYAVQGLFIPFDKICGPGAPLPVSFEELSRELGDLASQGFLTLKPFSSTLQPLAEPTCVAISPALVVGVLGAAALPVPVPVGGLLAPLSIVCSFGKGPDALQGLFVATSSALTPLVPAIDDAATVTSAAKPALDLLTPVTDRSVKPLCAVPSVGELGAALAIPLDVPLKPINIINTLLVPWCGEVKAEGEEPTGDDAPATPAPEPPVVAGTSGTPARTITVGVPSAPSALGGGPAVFEPAPAGPTVFAKVTRAGWLLVFATVLAALALLALIVPRRRAARLLLRLTR